MIGKWVHTPAQEDAACTSTGTLRYDVTTPNPISGFMLHWHGTGGSGTVATCEAAITDVRVIGDGLFLKNYNRNDAEDIVKYVYGTATPTTNADGAETNASLLIMFGRWLWDDLYNLDGSNYNKIEVEVVYSGAVGATKWASNYPLLDINIIEKINGRAGAGWLKSIEIDEHTSAAQTKTLDLNAGPNAPKLARIYTFCTNAEADLTDFKLYCNNGALVLADGDYNAYEQYQMSYYDLAATMSDNIMIDVAGPRVLNNPYDASRASNVRLEYSEAAGSTIRTVVEEIVARDRKN